MAKVVVAAVVRSIVMFLFEYVARYFPCGWDFARNGQKDFK